MTPPADVDPTPAARGTIAVCVADITTLAVDAVVNAANAGLRGGGGVDGAIHRAAGPALLAELARVAPDGCAPGDAVRTHGHRLPARWIIHAVGPVWAGGARGEPAVLARAYREAFARAREAGDVRSIAFPAIATGIYGYPKRDAAAIAVAAMRAHADVFARIVACCFAEADAVHYRDALAAHP